MMQINTEYSALMSKVMSNGNGRIAPINEPAEGKKNHKSRSILILWRTGIPYAIATDLSYQR
jgi:4-hydroxyphenylpyruvate dioxygenase